MKTLLLISFLFLGITGCVTHGDKDDETLRRVLVRFNSLQDSGYLPGLSSDEHGELSVFPITDAARAEDWFLPFRKAVQDCTRVVLVEVRAADAKQLRYFFCNSRHKPKILAVFQLKGTEWHPFQK